MTRLLDRLAAWWLRRRGWNIPPQWTHYGNRAYYNGPSMQRMQR